MHRDDTTFITRRQESVLATNKVLRNTYMLLSMTFLFSALMAYIGLATNAAPMNLLILIVGMYGLMFLTQAFKNSPLGLLFVFAFTGFLGYSTAPLLSFYLAHYSNGGQLIITALGGTGAIFFALSGYALITRKDFSYMQGFIFAGMMVLLLAMLAGFFFQIPGLQLAISAGFMLMSSGLILLQTSQIIHGGEDNYISATVTLFVSLYNIFLSLLQILGAFGGDD